jgi:hypothetical protein
MGLVILRCDLSSFLQRTRRHGSIGLWTLDVSFDRSLHALFAVSILSLERTHQSFATGMFLEYSYRFGRRMFFIDGIEAFGRGRRVD